MSMSIITKESALTSALRLAAAMIVLGAVALVALRGGGAPGDMLLSGAVARPLGDGAAAGYVTIDNRGAPDRLLAVSSPVAEAALYSPADAGGVPVPTGTASLALDAAHITLLGLTSAEHGSLIPVTLTFADAGLISTRLLLSDPAQEGTAQAHGLFGIGDICEVGEGEPAPAITLSVAREAEGYAVTVHTQEFTFSEDLTGLYHVPGMGHGHLYVGGMKIGRLYQDSARIGALPPGTHELRVTLNTNDHRAYVVDGQPVTASTTITVDE
jgi:copper(I)-binding protein